MARFPELRNRVAIVTGGTTGIGKAIAKELIDEDVRVMITALKNSVRAQRSVAELGASGGAVEYFIGDAANASDVQRMVEAASSRFGPVDILVNSAGGFPARRPVWETSEEEWDLVINANLKSVFLCTKAVLPQMIERGWGRIINIASEAGRMPVNTTAAHYAASKAGVIGFTKHVALETANKGVTVNATAPATTWSERVRNLYGDEVTRKMFESKSPMGRLAETSEQAGIVTFLCSDAASYITGACIDVAGAKVMI
ncbi:MAG: SDR family oxidoreductase [Chloroflexi bacterium]|nr:SDR family oxidoreductase [Chloroflexota bacterium]